MRMILLAGVAAGIAFAVSATGPIVFEEIAARAGIDFRSNSSPTPNKNQPETMVAGVGLLDYDRDGYLDIYFVNGAAIPSLNKETPVYRNRLYHNNQDGTFTDVTDKAGVGGGILDGKKMWSVSAVWLDYNNDGLLDLFVANYCKWEVNKDPFCGPKPEQRSYCHPKNYSPLPNTLYRNNGDGTFTDVSVETGISRYRGKGMGAVMADYDGDGFPDIFVPNDTMPNFLLHNLGGKKFEEVALENGVAYPESANALSGMGADFRDVDNDGRPDLWHTAIENESFPLYVNQAGGGFLEVTGPAKLGITRTMSGWSNGIFDFDNDGRKDLFVARGNVLDNVAMFSNRNYEEPNAVFRNLGNRKFQDVSAGAGPDFQKPAAHRGAAFGDLDNDGRIDAVVSVLNGKAKYFHNISPNTNHWILLELSGTKSNRMGIGARVRITAEDGSVQYNHVTTAVGYACSSDPRVHFGLGASKKIREMEIRWPSGIRQVIRDIPADQILKIQERAD